MNHPFFRKFFAHILSLGVLLLPFRSQALGGGQGGGGTGFTPVNLTNPLQSTTLYCFLFDVLTAFLNVLTIIAAFYIIYAGFSMVTARGNETQLKEAKKNFTYALIGTAVLLGATALAKIIQATVNAVVGTGGANNTTCP